MSFDDIIDRRNTHSAKWDMMEPIYGVPSDTGLSMWVADMDFRPPQCVLDAVTQMNDHGVYGYFGNDAPYRAAICWWMQNRHDWTVQPEWIFTTHGLVNAVGLCLDTYTQPGDQIVLMTPVYHAFARVIRASGREVVECPLATVDGQYSLDIPAWQAQLTGQEKMLILCSPHNPGGRVWSRDELEQIAEFARRNDLLLISDEIHQDLVYPGATHVPMAKVTQPEDALIMLTAASKTFNIAGAHTGNVIIPREDLRQQFANRMAGLGMGPNSFGLRMVTAAYSPEGAQWVDGLVAYLDENRRLFDAAVAQIPGAHSHRLQSTYLSWVDFSGMGMKPSEVIDRVQNVAQIAANHGDTFGRGGESFLRFNLGMPRAHIEQACERLQRAFADLQ